MEVLGGRVTNPGATLTAWTVNTGNSLTVRSFDFASGAFLLNAWGQWGTDGRLRIRSPRMHDNVQGIRLVGDTGDVRALLPPYMRQRLYPQDTLIVEQSGSAAAVDVGALVVYYQDLPGVSARLATWDEIAPRIANYLTVEQNLTTGATAGDWGGEQAITADFDVLKANVDYAILGCEVDAAATTVGIRGPATGNLRVGIPAALDQVETRDFFVRLSMATGLPAIPVFNAADRAGTLVDISAVATAAARNVGLILAELG